MPEVVNRFIDKQFAQERSKVLRLAKQLLGHERAEFEVIGQALDAEYSEAATQAREAGRQQEHVLRAQGQLSSPDAAASERVQRTSAKASGSDNGKHGAAATATLQTTRLRFALEDLLVQYRDDNPLQLLGENIPRAQRVSNARRALLVAASVVDPDASEWLGDITELSVGDWNVQTGASVNIVGRASICQTWGQIALELLHDACVVLNATAGFPPDETALGCGLTPMSRVLLEMCRESCTRLLDAGSAWHEMSDRPLSNEEAGRLAKDYLCALGLMRTAFERATGSDLADWLNWWRTWSILTTERVEAECVRFALDPTAVTRFAEEPIEKHLTDSICVVRRLMHAARLAPPSASDFGDDNPEVSDDSSGQTEETWTWQKARDRAKVYLRSNPFPGVRPLARLVGSCPPATMSKAIASDPELKRLRNEAIRGRKGASTPWGDAAGDAIESIADPTSPDESAEMMADGVLDQLKQEAMRRNEGRVRVLTPAEQGPLLELLRNAIIAGDADSMKVAQDTVRERLRARS